MILDDLAQGQWHKGQLLAFSALDGATAYDGGLVARTVVTPPGIEIWDPERCLLAFEDAPVDQIVFGGDFFRFSGSDSSTRGAVVDSHHLLIEGTCAVSGSLEKLSCLQKEGRLLIGTQTHFDATLIDADLDALISQRSRWLLSRTLPAEVAVESRHTLARALTLMKSQVYAPEGVFTHRWTTPDRWPHKDIWLWDSAFHAIGWRHIDPALAMEILDGLFDLQRADGFLTYRGTPAGPFSHLGDLVTQPPVLAHAVDLVYAKTQDARWLQSIYPKLAAYVDWDLQNRDTDGGGLAEWFIEDDVNCRSGESGMDNSPRFDSARRLDAVDFNSFLARECEVLARLATTLELASESERWLSRHRRLCELINEKFWSEQDGFYFDYDPVRDERSSVMASSGFLPLFCGAASPAQAEALARHLADPGSFATNVPVASVAVSDDSSYSKDMWRGPMWVNINWLIVSGFERYGLHEQASSLRQTTLREIERCCEKFGVFFEYYDDRGEVEPPDLLRKQENNPENPYRQVIHEFGWSATLYVDLLLDRQ